jgi:hypothetical protein
MELVDLRVFGQGVDEALPLGHFELAGVFDGELGHGRVNSYAVLKGESVRALGGCG